ncbi:MAG: UDP-N-acetylmuramate dehydrogenase [Balneolaceae bacterium]
MNSPAIHQNYNLIHHNTMGIAARARFFIGVKSMQDLKTVLKKRYKELPLLIIGGGSNLLFVNDFEGLVIHNQIAGIEIIGEKSDQVELKIGAGENWHELVLYCVNRGLGGIENLSLIPGSAGAAPIQNIGAYGVELEEVFVSLEALETASGMIKTFNKKECEFAYRESIFKTELKGKFIITSITLRLKKNASVNTTYKALAKKLEEKGISNPGIKDVSEAVIEIRQSKLPDPTKIGNTGSFFKNPVLSKARFEELRQVYPDMPNYPAGKKVKIPAAWLIDQCGWKGKRFGDAGVHKLQALVIVNYGGASGEEIWNLAGRIQESVRQKFGVALTPEVNVVL